MRAWLTGLAGALLLLGAAAADERESFNRRAAEADLAAFERLDLNGDGMLQREEARGEVAFSARFHDIDINRDGVVTRAEMLRYLEHTYGVRPARLAGGR